MSAITDEVERRGSGHDGGSSPESLLWTRLTPFRSQATRLGFDFVRRECSRSDGMTHRLNVFVHPDGTWLDLRASVDRTMHFGPVMASFRSWALDGGELIEVTTLAGTLAADPSLPRNFIDFVERLLGENRDIHPLHSPADLAGAFAHHRYQLDERGLTPLVSGEDALEERTQWERTVTGNVWLIAPP